MRIAVAVFAAALLLTGCKKVVGPAAPDAQAEAPAAAVAADAAAPGDAVAAPAPSGDRAREEGNTDRGNRGNDDREDDGNTDRGNRGNDDREGEVTTAAPQG